MIAHDPKSWRTLLADPAEKVLVSACLAGEACRYDGRSNADARVQALAAAGRAVIVCPEVAGGLKIPRIPAEIRVAGAKRKVYNKQNHDVTAAYERGAAHAVARARACGCRLAILKARSPACGCGEIYDGSFSHRLTAGNGIAAQALMAAGVIVITEETLRADPADEPPLKEPGIRRQYGR